MVGSLSCSFISLYDSGIFLKADKIYKAVIKVSSLNLWLTLWTWSAQGLPLQQPLYLPYWVTIGFWVGSSKIRFSFWLWLVQGTWQKLIHSEESPELLVNSWDGKRSPFGPKGKAHVSSCSWQPSCELERGQSWDKADRFLVKSFSHQIQLSVKVVLL